MTNALLTAALSYAARGWRVFPLHNIERGACSCGSASCHSPGKHPRTKHGCKDASLDAAQLQAWWHRWPNANPGLATGPHSGLWVLDCDQPSQLQALQQKLRIKLPTTLTAITARGLHLYWKWAVGVRTRSAVFPGLDVRGEGGYVVAPPSLHLSGDYYQWQDPSCPITEAPAALLALASAHRPVDTPQRVSGHLTPYQKAAIESATQAVQSAASGARNDTLNREAYSLAGLGIPEALLFDTLSAAAQTAGLSTREIALTLKSAISSGASKPRALATQTTPKLSTEQRKMIVLPNNQEEDLNDQVIKSLGSINELYQRGQQLVSVYRDVVPAGKLVLRPPGAPGIHDLSVPRLRELISRVTDWRRYVASKQAETQLKVIEVPTRNTEAIAARRGWSGIRPLEGITELPVLRPDGSLCDTPGYDPSTGLLYLPNAQFLPIPKHPTQEDAHRAAQEILSLVCDFPFLSEAHRAAWLAALLTPFARYAFLDPVPIFTIDANIRSAGKTKLADLISIIFCGRSMPRYGYRDDDAELAKAITVAVSSADPFLLFDNVDKPLGGEALDRALTGTVWQERVLGKNKGAEAMVQAPMRVTFYATGNNLAFKGDTYSRAISIRLESPLERPEDRDNFTISNIEAETLARRPRLVAACLTILRAYQAAGCPGVLDGPTRFRGWDLWVRAPIVFAGLPDPKAAKEQDNASVDQDATSLSLLLSAWEELAGQEAITVAEALHRYETAMLRYRENPADNPMPYPMFREMLSSLFGVRPGEMPKSAMPLGYKLRAFRQRRCQGRYLDNMSKAGDKSVAHWALLR
jgi:hypothetical protein